jgi:hypothetical protein
MKTPEGNAAMIETDGKPYIMTEVGVSKSESVSSAPNGSTRNNRDFYTYVTYMQDWISGPYAGCTYKIVERYISSNPDTWGQYLGSSSTFVVGPEN